MVRSDDTLVKAGKITSPHSLNFTMLQKISCGENDSHILSSEEGEASVVFGFSYLARTMCLNRPVKISRAVP